MTATVSSVTKQGRYEPFDLQVARGQVYGHSTVNIYGFQNALNSTTAIAVWENASAYAYPGSAVAMTVASASGATDAGVKVQVQGLDANYAILNETVTLNASGTATTTGLFLRINALVVTLGNPAGIVTAKNGGTTYAQISVGFGRSQMSLYTVPAGYTFYLERIQAFTSASGYSADYVVYRNWSQSASGVQSVAQNAAFVNNYETHRVMPRPFSEKTDIQLQARVNANSYVVSIAAEGYLIQNDVLTNITP